MLWRTSGLDQVAMERTSHAGIPPAYGCRFNDLRISYFRKKITQQAVIEQVNTELKEPERSAVMSNLNGASMFGTRR